jgi:ribosomal protein S18 acetylase RimI-like enzyme
MDEHRIIPAYDHINDIRTLFQEYITVEYEKKRGIQLGFQHIEEEIESLPGSYAEPTGGLFLLYWSENIAGCAAFRKINHSSCELKRLYIREQFRGFKLGHKLLYHTLSEAKKKGYIYAYCDTLSTMTEAIAIYHKMEFVETEPYYENPLQGVLYFKKTL